VTVLALIAPGFAAVVGVITKQHYGWLTKDRPTDQ